MSDFVNDAVSDAVQAIPTATDVAKDVAVASDSTQTLASRLAAVEEALFEIFSFVHTTVVPQLNESKVTTTLSAPPVPPAAH